MLRPAPSLRGIKRGRGAQCEEPSRTPLLRPQGQFVSAFKQSPRREDDISTVTAAMSVAFSPGSDIVEDLKLSYGGMAATTVMAAKTAARLVGR